MVEAISGTDAMTENEPAYRVRPMRADEAEAVLRLIHTTIAESYAAVYPPRAVPFFQRFHSAEVLRDRARAGTVLVLEEAGAIVGTGALIDGEILAVFVAPDRQGGGRGRALMAALEAQARSDGCDAVTLSISLPSKAFYDGLGYQVLEERTRDLGGGESLRFWKGRKALAPR
jgi:GNAT superfamily N-acetyltransferase